MLMNEVFGEENIIARIAWQKRYLSNVTATCLSDLHDHILVFAREIDCISVNSYWSPGRERSLSSGLRLWKLCPRPGPSRRT